MKDLIGCLLLIIFWGILFHYILGMPAGSEKAVYGIACIMGFAINLNYFGKIRKTL